MILDRPPIHRFNAVEHVPRTVSPHPLPLNPPPLAAECDGIRWQMTRGTIDLFQPNRFDSTAGNVIDPEEVDMRLCSREVKPFAPRCSARSSYRVSFFDAQLRTMRGFHKDHGSSQVINIIRSFVDTNWTPSRKEYIFQFVQKYIIEIEFTKVHHFFRSRNE